MKVRTIEELHDPRIGHRRFAAVVDGLVANGHKVTDIKEYNEHFKYKVDGYQLQFRKDWKSTAKNFIKYVEDLLLMKNEIDRKKGS